MVEHIDSAESVSLRIWFAWQLRQLGWPFPEPILSGFDWPFSTWEDNCQSLGHEAFPAAIGPAPWPPCSARCARPKRPPAPGPAANRLSGGSRNTPCAMPGASGSSRPAPVARAV